MTYHEETAIRAHMVKLNRASETLWNALQFCIDMQVQEGLNPYNPTDAVSEARTIIARSIKFVADEWVALRTRLNPAYAR